MNELKDQEELNKEQNQGPASDEAMAAKKKWFGRGIYGSKDVPIRILDVLIAVVLGVIILLTVIFTVNGGFQVKFDSDGGTAVEQQKIRHGKLVLQPNNPEKMGYEFGGWYTEENKKWDFSKDKIGGALTLYAKWNPAHISVKFDLAGGNVNGNNVIDETSVIFQETYGKLPEPQKDGYTFDGWYYGGSKITEDTIVTMPGEHVLTAYWK